MRTDQDTRPRSPRQAVAWQPDRRLPDRVASPGWLTTNVYHGQPDPFEGGRVASCAPADALRPDGTPMRLLCKQVEQATTDSDGRHGLAATIDPAVPPRVQRWTYDAFGQVLSATRVGHHGSDTITYTYYADTTADHRAGDLQSVTNAHGQTTHYQQYNASGQVLRRLSHDGILTVNTYDHHQRLRSTSVDGKTTVYEYGPGMLLSKVKPAEFGFASSERGAARRLAAVSAPPGSGAHGDRRR